MRPIAHPTTTESHSTASCQGYKACEAVVSMSGNSAGDAVVQRRAQLCMELHEREVQLLVTARRQLSETEGKPAAFRALDGP